MSERQVFTTKSQEVHFYDLVVLNSYRFNISLSPIHRYTLYVAGGTKQVLADAALFALSDLRTNGTITQAILEGAVSIITSSYLSSSGNVEEAIWNAEASLLGQSNTIISAGLSIPFEATLLGESSLISKWSNLIWEGQIEIITSSSMLSSGTTQEATWDALATLVSTSEARIDASAVIKNGTSSLSTESSLLVSAGKQEAIWEAEATIITDSSMLSIANKVANAEVTIITSSNLLAKPQTETHIDYLYTVTYIPENYFMQNYFPKL